MPTGGWDAALQQEPSTHPWQGSYWEESCWQQAGLEPPNTEESAAGGYIAAGAGQGGSSERGGSFVRSAQEVLNSAY